MKNHILDASSIYTLVKHVEDDSPRILKANTTIPLAAYELGNAIWREVHLLKLLSEDEGKELLMRLFTLVETMTILHFNPRREGEAVLESALVTGLNFYDSSYLAAAIKTGCPLVTEDKQLSKVANRAGVKTLSWRDI